MRLDTQSYNNGTTSYNASAQETNIISYAIQHRFNNPALCTIILKDPDASMFKKYNVDDNDVYLGVGKIELEDPTGTDIFLGRILKVRHNMKDHKTYLLCEDWLGQLDEDRINYDMREALNDAGLRQSIISSDVDGTCTPVSQTFMYAVADDGGALTTESDECNNDTINDMILLPAVPVVNDAYYFGFDAATETKFYLDISTVGVGTWTVTWEFYAGGFGWIGLINGSDGSSGFTVAGVSTISWTFSALWATVAVNGITKYWVRARVSAYTSVTTPPKGAQAWVPQTLYDDDIEDFTADEWIGKYLIFPSAAAGTQTIITGPYGYTMGLGTTTAGDHTDVWLDDVNFHDMTNADNMAYVKYDFHVNVDFGSLYVSGPSAGKIHVVCKAYTDDTVVEQFRIVILNSDETVYIAHISYDVDQTSTETRRYSITLPEAWLQTVTFIDSVAEITCGIQARSRAGDNAFLDVYQCLLELTYVVEGDTTAHDIIDNTTNSITTPSNLTYNGLGCWERMPYSIAKKIYKHIDTAEGGTLISDGDVVNAITAAATIEHTTGITTRNYQEMTRLEILRDLNDVDNAVFWMTLGGVILTRKSTFNSGAPTALTDALVLSWANCEYDYEPMRNEYHVYGVRIGDNQLYRDTSALSTDPGADSKAKFVATRSEVVRNTGTLSQYETDSLGAALVERDEDVLLFLEATLKGLDSTYRLGTEVAVTSAYLGLTAANYVVTGWNYDSTRHATYIILQPRSSIGYQNHFIGSPLSETMKAIKKAIVDTYTPSLSTQEW